jgi:hypothetical protein
MADTDIAMRAPAATTNIILAATATSPGLWVNVAGASKRAVGVWVNDAGTAKALTSLPCNVAGAAKDMVFE